jgi:hypothetical protein
MMRVSLAGRPNAHPFVQYTLRLQRVLRQYVLQSGSELPCSFHLCCTWCDTLLGMQEDTGWPPMRVASRRGSAVPAVRHAGRLGTQLAGWWDIELIANDTKENVWVRQAVIVGQ